MREYASDVAFTPSVKAIQEEKGSRAAYAKVEQGHGWEQRVTPELKEFLAQRDMFYLGSSNAEGQPYIQYRGGPAGFLQVLDEQTLAFADFGGNRQYITLGNLAENPKVIIFLIDYLNRRRIKIWGTAKVVEDDPELLDQLRDESYPSRVERAIVFNIEAWDVNCPQHIHQRLPATQVAEVVGQLKAKIERLESELEMLRSND